MAHPRIKAYFSSASRQASRNNIHVMIIKNKSLQDRIFTTRLAPLRTEDEDVPLIFTQKKYRSSSRHFLCYLQKRPNYYAFLLLEIYSVLVEEIMGLCLSARISAV